MGRVLPRLRATGGRLTAELVQAPGRFGLGRVPARLEPDATTTVVCGFCSTGCGLDVHLRGGEAVNLSPSVTHPVNLGMACPKGWEALTPLGAPDRATTPLVRERGRLVPVGWDAALRVFAERVGDIQRRHGRDAVAFLGTGQVTTEELAFLGALAKFGLGMVHGDANTRQCMATAATAYKQAFGFDAPPFTYADFEASDVIVLVGSNLCIAHPIMWQRILRNPHRPEVVVLDPRRTETAMAATQHHALRPKSDLVLLYGLAQVFCTRGWVDRDFVARHTSGFEAFRAHVAAFPPERVCAATGLSAEALERLARTIHDGRRVSFWWTMGVNQGHEATRTAQAIIALALLTGNVGRPGTGANSITGQCNAMGSRLFGNTSSLLGGRDFASADDRAAVARVLGIDARHIPATPGMAYDEIVDAIADGRIRGLWVVGTNGAHSWIEQQRLTGALARLELLVVQDMYATTETARLAHLVLPAAGWGEKDGTFINSERRIGLVKKVARAPGQALADFAVFRLVADAMGVGDMFARWSSPEAAFEVLRELSCGQPCDFSGVRDWRMLDEEGGVQWPYPEDAASPPARERRLFADGRFFHRDGRARFLVAAPAPLPEPPCEAYPLLLLTGRGSSAQWHTGTRTDKSPVLRKLAPRALRCEMHPADAARLALADGAVVVVASRRGRVRAALLVTPTVQPGQVFLPMHDPAVNRLTLAAFDPHSRQPAYKACAVRVVRAGPSASG
jgi:assimilatory nitrate reductase catalytic subunit